MKILAFALALLACGTAGAVPAKVAWIGNSITYGAASRMDIPPPHQAEITLTTRYPVLAFCVADWGIPSSTSTIDLSTWETKVRGKGYGYLWILTGVNDLLAAADNAGAQAAAVATVEANMTTMISEALAEGLEITLITLTPWNSYASSSANRQTATVNLNTWISSQAATHVKIYNAYADPLLGVGSPPSLINTDDGLHPLQAGSDVMAAGALAAQGL